MNRFACDKLWMCVCVCVSSVRWLNFNKVNHSDTKYCTILLWYRSRCWTQANSYTVIFLSVNYTLIKATTLRWLMVLVHVIALFNVDFSDYISETDFCALSLSHANDRTKFNYVWRNHYDVTKNNHFVKSKELWSAVWDGHRTNFDRWFNANDKPEKEAGKR